MFSRKKLAIAASTICLITVVLFLQIGVFANQTQTTAGDFTVEATEYDVFYDCNRDGTIELQDIFGCILRYDTYGAPVRIGYLSVPPAAFHSIRETQSYEKGIFAMYGQGSFLVEVYLPHGANITGMAVYLHDDSPSGHVSVQLVRVNIASSYEEMALVTSGTVETPGTVKLVDDTIDYPTINNDGYSYELHLGLSAEAATLRLDGVIIVYEYTP